MIQTLDLIDGWRVNNPVQKKFTWVSPWRPAQMARLDFFLLTPDLHAKIVKYKISPGYRTDHSFLSIELDTGEMRRGNGFWKMNTSLLHDEDYVKLVKKTIQDTISDYSVGNDSGPNNAFTINDQMFFEMIKLNIRGKSISYSSYKAKKIKRQETKLEQNLKDLEESLTFVNDSSKTDILDEIEVIKQELQVVREPKIKALMLRSRIQVYEEGEKPSKYFCNLEHRNYINKTISRLQVNDSIINDPKEILCKQKCFYQNLYSSNLHCESTQALDTFLKEENITKLSDGMKNKCEGQIIESEAKLAIRNMKNNKTPGSDGFSAEFYKFFWTDIGSFLLRSLNMAITTDELSLTQKQGIITCMPKGDKPRQFLKNWRPITLLNVDYKILSSILANRIKSVLPGIISDDQKGFLKNRYIGENIRTVYDIMHELEKRGKSGLLLLIDFEKAFDSIEWNYIRKVLKSYNFGESFISWFDILYKNSCSCVLNNGHFSEFFNLGRSCRQGDPLSPYLFILSIEPLAMEVKRNPNIKGIQIDDKIGQYADDTYLLLDGSESSLRSSMDLFSNFATCSGLKVNVEKTHVVWLGIKKNNITKLGQNLDLQWNTEFTLLGIKFCVEMDDMIRINYSEKLISIKKILQFYSKLNLSLIGKVTVIKTLVIPKLVYLFSVLPTPAQTYIKDIEKLFREFIWNSKKARISLNQLENNISEGGLKLTNINAFCAALKLSWIKRLITSDGSWQSIFQYSISQDKINIWCLDVMSLFTLSSNISNAFWKDIFYAWAKYKSNFTDDINIRSYPIWNSNFILNPNLISRKLEFQNKSVNYINDLLDDQGNVLGYEDFKQKSNMEINFIDFYSLTHSIPRLWRNDINNNPMKLQTIEIKQKCLEEIIRVPKVCKATYWIFISMIDNKTLYISKWNIVLQESFTKEAWGMFFKVGYQSTIESKLRAFQYKILTRILPTKKFLHLCNIVNDNNCYFCGRQVETLEHIFWRCDKIQGIFMHLKPLLATYINMEIFRETNFLLGISGVENEKLINHLFMIIKRYIYVTKCLEKELNFTALLNYIRFHFLLEKNLSDVKRNGKNVFNGKWGPLLPYFATLEAL